MLSYLYPAFRQNPLFSPVRAKWICPQKPTQTAGQTGIFSQTLQLYLQHPSFHRQGNSLVISPSPHVTCLFKCHPPLPQNTIMCINYIY